MLSDTRLPMLDVYINTPRHLKTIMLNTYKTFSSWGNWIYDHLRRGYAIQLSTSTWYLPISVILVKLLSFCISCLHVVVIKFYLHVFLCHSALAVHVSGSKIYWSDSKTKTINRCSINGSNMEKILEWMGLVEGKKILIFCVCKCICFIWMII